MPATDPPPVLFRRLLGGAYDLLPPQIRAVHDAPGTWRGRCRVERGEGIAARLLAALMALPPPGRHDPIEVAIEPHRQGESWTRAIGGVRMRSRLRQERGRLAESMGPATFRFEVESDGSRIRWRLCSVRALGIPLPTRLFAIEACESVEGPHYRFQVSAALAGTGRLVAYDGILEAPVAR